MVNFLRTTLVASIIFLAGSGTSRAAPLQVMGTSAGLAENAASGSGGAVVLTTDLDLGAKDTAGNIGQEVIVVYPFLGSFQLKGELTSEPGLAKAVTRIIAFRPDGSVRFDTTVNP